jgi:hypothetical protein
VPYHKVCKYVRYLIQVCKVRSSTRQAHHMQISLLICLRRSIGGWRHWAPVKKVEAGASSHAAPPHACRWELQKLWRLLPPQLRVSKYKVYLVDQHIIMVLCTLPTSLRGARGSAGYHIRSCPPLSAASTRPRANSATQSPSLGCSGSYSLPASTASECHTP